MKHRSIFSLFIVLFAATFLFAQKPLVYQCATKQKISDNLLEETLQKSAAENQSVRFLTNDSPCDHTKHIAGVLDKTVGNKSFTQSAGHSFSFLKNGEYFFQIERFVFKNKQTANLVNQLLTRRNNNILPIPALTGFEFVQRDNNLLFFIAAGASYKKNQPLFGDIKTNFLNGSK